MRENFKKVVAHETEWNFLEETRINNFTAIKSKPKLNIGNVQDMNELDMWLIFFPIENIHEILEASNSHLGDDKTNIDKAAFFKVIWMLYAMSTNILHSRRKYWATNEDKSILLPPAFGRRFEMGYHKFETILQSLLFSLINNGDNHEENENRWAPIQAFIDMLHTKWQDVIQPGYKLCVDESMFAWYGRGNYDPNGMPSVVIKISSKPKDVEYECKTLADAQSNVMLRLEINEGKTEMAKKNGRLI